MRPIVMLSVPTFRSRSRPPRQRQPVKLFDMEAVASLVRRVASLKVAGGLAVASGDLRRGANRALRCHDCHEKTESRALTP